VRILSRHFLASYLGFYAAILVASLLVIAIIEMMLNLDRALEFQSGALGVATYLLLRLPSYYLPYLLPVTSFGAAFLCIGLSARAQEIVAAKAGGVPPQRIAAPVLCAAVALAVAALGIFETLVRDSGAAYERTRRGDASITLFRNEGSFWYQRGRLLYNVQSADRETRTLHDVRVYERDDAGRLRRAIHAESARIADDHRWELHRATIRSFDLADPSAAPSIERREQTQLDVASEQDLALLDADASSLPLPELSAYIQAMERSGRDSTRYRALLHARLAEPLTVPLFALLAVPLGLGVERTRNLAIAALQGIALLGAFYGVVSTTQILAAGGVAAAVPAPWVVLSGFAGFGAWRLLRTPA
jgi:lipopolysaccharide export system permease protein